MTHQLAGYELMKAVERFSWCRYSAQADSGVTYLYLSSRLIPRVAGVSSVLYIGKTEQSIDKRVKDETMCTNTPGNTQNTNIRLAAVLRQLRSSGYSIETFFTTGLFFTPSTEERTAMLRILEIWDKRCWVDFSRRGLLEMPIEKFLLCHYAALHLELPPLNNSM